MKFIEISPKELKDYQIKSQDRHLFCQDGDFAELAGYKEGKSKILAVKESDEILAYGIFIYYQYRKIFRIVNTQFGPIMDYSDEKLVEFYFDNLIKYMKKDKRVTKLVVNPFINAKIFNDIDLVSTTEISKNIEKFLLNKNFKKILQTFIPIER